MKSILILVCAGIVSTMMMDIASTATRACGITAGVPADLVGKWMESSIRGQVIVDDIRTSNDNSVPLARVLLYHYIIGIVLTGFFYAISHVLKLTNIPWWIPLFYGFSTTSIPAFFMFPAMGFGVCGLNAPPEYLLLRTATLNHFFFGLGLTITFPFAVKRFKQIH